MEETDCYHVQKSVEGKSLVQDCGDWGEWDDLPCDSSDVEDYGYLGLTEGAYDLHRAKSCAAVDKLLQYVLDPQELQEHFKTQLQDLHLIYEDFPEGYYLELLETHNFNLKSIRQYLIDHAIDLIERFPKTNPAIDPEANCPVCMED